MEIGSEILLEGHYEGTEALRRCSRRAADRAAVPAWFRMFLTDEVMSEKTKRQRLSCKVKYKLVCKIA